MPDSIPTVPHPRNEPVLSYAPATAERAALKAELDRLAGARTEIPLVIGGERVTTGDIGTCVQPHDRHTPLATYHKAGPAQVALAIDAAREAKPAWEAMSWEDRCAILLRAAELLAGKWRATANAATMLNQSKTAHQAEIDSACELIDFWRFNPYYAAKLYADVQPDSAPGTWNRVELRPLEGFVFAVTPFNFTSIAGNLPTAPALMGNTVVWKPASTAVLSAWIVMQVLEEAGLPPGVINFVPGSGAAVGDAALDSPELAGIHFTGSTDVFRAMWKRTANQIDRYRSYPRIVGETGGKDFIVAHTSADPDALVTAIVRGGFEYQGQKCSAASRVYVPNSLWLRIRDQLADTTRDLTMGDVRDFRNFMGAVIDGAAFAKHRDAIERARADSDAEVLVGGETDDSTGWFVRPTIIVAKDPAYRTMQDELFGPIVTVYVYPDTHWDHALDLVDATSPYGLTGAVFAADRSAILEATRRLRHAAGNFYINDKPTGAVVGQQPFGGSRASGTNDKAGSALNLLRWTSARTIKETFAPPTDYRYPFMADR
ncbi:MAG: L-glutamate gamma-semialdehyde dehydrogenase [Deltaproteobacteria bacterium]|nr:MAG: L-glutamate gamma-semialdehyde dehydrogenase [Deltaproteobacteria bacterium]